MNKILNSTLVCCLTFCGFAFANESETPVILPMPVEKTGKIERAYRFATKIDGTKQYKSVMILEDGYTIYNIFEKDDIWAVGDDVVIQNPYLNNNIDVVGVNIENLTQGKKITAVTLGWALPTHIVISDVKYEKNEANKLVTVTLKDDSQWRFSYSDEYAHAKHWRKGDKVLIVIDTLDGNTQNPFPGPYVPEYEYNMINLNIKQHAFAGEPAELVQYVK